MITDYNNDKNYTKLFPAGINFFCVDLTYPLNHGAISSEGKVIVFKSCTIFLHHRDLFCSEIQTFVLSN